MGAARRRESGTPSYTRTLSKICARRWQRAQCARNAISLLCAKMQCVKEGGWRVDGVCTEWGDTRKGQGKENESRAIRKGGRRGTLALGVRPRRGRGDAPLLREYE